MSSSLSSLSFGVVGGGIGGLPAAVALAQRGAFVRVCEQASHFVPTVGAGFGFSPNGQVCLKSLGIEARPQLHRFDRLIHINKEGHQTHETDVFRQVQEKHGFTVGGCLRAELVKTLSKSLDEDTIQYSHKVVGMEQNDDSSHSSNNKVKLEFQDGKKAEHDILIGADGIHSSVADILAIDPSPPVFSGANIFYGLIKDPDRVTFQGESARFSAQDHAVVQGNVTGQFITFRAGDDKNKLQIWANTNSSETPPSREEWGKTDPSD